MQHLKGFLLKDNRYDKALPKNHMLEDIFLVSYPKSGNTWLRFLIANALKFHFGIDREVNFFTIQDIIPGMKDGNSSLSPSGPFGILTIPRIIKSHASYNPHYHRVILLVRDPRDVITSYYFYRKYYGLESLQTSLSSFIRDSESGVNAWKLHTESWFLRKKQGQIIKLFTYENFIEDTQKNLNDLMNLLGFKLDALTLDKAVDFSSKEWMRKSELKHTSTYLNQNRKYHFVGKAKAARGEPLLEEDKKFIEDQTRDIAKMIGYEY